MITSCLPTRKGNLDSTGIESSWKLLEQRAELYDNRLQHIFQEPSCFISEYNNQVYLLQIESQAPLKAHHRYSPFLSKDTANKSPFAVKRDSGICRKSADSNELCTH